MMIAPCFWSWKPKSYEINISSQGFSYKLNISSPIHFYFRNLRNILEKFFIQYDVAHELTMQTYVNEAREMIESRFTNKWSFIS